MNRMIMCAPAIQPYMDNDSSRCHFLNQSSFAYGCFNILLEKKRTSFEQLRKPTLWNDYRDFKWCNWISCNTLFNGNRAGYFLFQSKQSISVDPSFHPPYFCMSNASNVYELLGLYDTFFIDKSCFLSRHLSVLKTAKSRTQKHHLSCVLRPHKRRFDAPEFCYPFRELEAFQKVFATLDFELETYSENEPVLSNSHAVFGAVHYRFLFMSHQFLMAINKYFLKWYVSFPRYPYVHFEDSIGAHAAFVLFHCNPYINSSASCPKSLHQLQLPPPDPLLHLPEQLLAFPAFVLSSYVLVKRKSVRRLVASEIKN
jgi:hypothetical protein